LNSDLRDLYQDVILDHGRRPRNARAIEGDEAFVKRQPAHNPLCGDRGTLYLVLDHAGTRIEDAGYIGQGCSISTASASLMTEYLRGRPIDEALAAFERFRRMVTGRSITGGSGDGPDLGKLAVFSGVAEFPARVKCATLPWHALRAALGQGPAATASSEQSE
jgi:nitrogen fixation NifU-like protein